MGLSSSERSFKASFATLSLSYSGQITPYITSDEPFTLNDIRYSSACSSPNAPTTQDKPAGNIPRVLSKKLTAARILKGRTCLSAKRQFVKYASGKSNSNSQPGSRDAIGSCIAVCQPIKLTPRSWRAGGSACHRKMGESLGALKAAIIKRGSANTAIVSDILRNSSLTSFPEIAAVANASVSTRV